MKKHFNFLLFTGLLVATLAFVSCQKEKYAVEYQEDQETLVANSATAILLEQIAINDGSWDNIVDGASCFNIRFPYKVVVNEIEISVNSTDDFKTIEELFDAIDTNEDVLDILFPITIINSEHNEVSVNNLKDLHELTAQCIEGGQDDDIECVDVVYPLKFYKFDVSLAQPSDYIIKNDKELRLFMTSLANDEIISIQYPIVFELFDGTEVQVNSNSELVATLENAKNACDEDDDNDYNDDDFTKEHLDKLLIECPWSIKEIYRDNLNKSTIYGEYLIEFSDDGGVNVIDRLGNAMIGEWQTRIAENQVLLKLEFSDLVDFNLEWFIYEIQEGIIKLYTDSHNKIIMKSVCEEIKAESDTLRGILKECSWLIKKVKVDGKEIIGLLGNEFEFKAENILTLNQGETTLSGNWRIFENAQGRLVLSIDIGQEPNVSFEWPLSELRNDRLVFKISGTNHELIIQRVCNNNNDDEDVMTIRNVLLNGDWHVSSYKNAKEDKTEYYNGFYFDFSDEHLISINNSQAGEISSGYWRVIRNYDNQVKFFLNLGENEPLGNLTEDWNFVSHDENRVELKNLKEDGSYDILVFAK